MHLLRILALAACVAGLPACAGATRYATERAWDASDLVRGHVMAGVGFDVKAEATRLVGCGGGGYSAKAWGFVDRRLCTWSETITDLGFFWCEPAMIVNLHEEAALEGLKRVSGSYTFAACEGSNGGASAQPRPSDTCGWLDLFTLRLTAFCFVGFDLELRLGELADLALGVAGVDPCGDDPRRGGALQATAMN
jgi:hypothetical protein